MSNTAVLVRNVPTNDRPPSLSTYVYNTCEPAKNDTANKDHCHFVSLNNLFEVVFIIEFFYSQVDRTRTMIYQNVSEGSISDKAA